MTTSQEWIGRMNVLGSARTPFLFVLDFDLQEPLVVPLNEINEAGLWYEIRGKGDVLPGTDRPPVVRLEKNPVAFVDYKVAFDQVMDELDYGNSFLLNLTCSTPIHINLTLEEIFQHSKAKYKLYLQDQCVVFSPETFVRIQDDRIFAYPMKGTIDAALPDAEMRILESPKEKAEHITIVDLLRNDLSRVAKDVRVDRFRYVEEVRTHEKTLLQVSSEISGELQHDWAAYLGDLFAAMLPAGSVSGAPKKKTVEIIRHAETHERGYFTGVFGVFDGENVDSGVMIRFIEKQGDQLVFKSGGGITTQSIAEEEYQEMIDKVYVPVY